MHLLMSHFQEVSCVPVSGGLGQVRIVEILFDISACDPVIF